MKTGYFLGILFIISCCCFSCRSVKKTIVHKEIPNITENRLLKNVYANEPNFNSLYSKRMDVSFTQGGKVNSLRGTLKIQRDSFIQISISAPLGIEVGRILLTRDSVKFIDSYHKKYFLSDYKYFYDKFDANLSYDCLQKILTNTFFDFESCNGTESKEKKYKLDKADNSYILSTLEEKALGRKIKKLYRKKRKNKEFVLILQRIQVDPLSFRPLSVLLEDVDEEAGINVSYNDFRDFDGVFFPEKVAFIFFSDKDKMGLEIRFNRLEFNIDVEPNFKISPKYKRIDQL